MKKILTTILMLSVMVFSGCDDDSTAPSESYTLDDLVGTWDKTSGTDTYTESASGITEDMCTDEMGGTFSNGLCSITDTESWVSDSTNTETLVISADGTFTVTATDDGYADDPFSGTLTVSGNDVSYTITDEEYGEQTVSGTVSISGTTATFDLDIEDSYTYNYDGTAITISFSASFNWIYEKVVE